MRCIDTLANERKDASGLQQIPSLVCCRHAFEDCQTFCRRMGLCLTVQVAQCKRAVDTMYTVVRCQ